MSISAPVYHQLLNLLRQHTLYRDFRHLKALAWMINALICSGTINLSEWEAYVPTKAKQAQSSERRWQRFLRNRRLKIRSLYIPLVMAAIDGWQAKRLYFTTWQKNERIAVIAIVSRYSNNHISLTLY